VLVNGRAATAGCDSTITFTSAGFAPAFRTAGARGAAGSPPWSYDVLMQIVSDGPRNDPKAGEARQVEVMAGFVPTTTTTTTTTTSTSTTTLPSNPCLGDTTPPAVTLLSPPPLPVYNELSPADFPVPFRALASDLNGVSQVEYLLDVLAVAPPVSGGTGLRPIPGALSSTGPSYAFDWTLGAVQGFLGSSCTATATVVVRATDTCGNSADVRSLGIVTFLMPATCSGPPISFLARPDEPRSAPPAESASAWVSQLEVPGGRGQLVLNGRQALFPGLGRSSLPVRLEAGENRVEATLVQAQGKAGFWRFEPGAERGLAAGSLRVITGEVALVTPDAVVFRMKGRPGERVVFTFWVRP